MNILDIAKESGIIAIPQQPYEYAEVMYHPSDMYNLVNDKTINAFAAAISAKAIEEFKASLVPVAYEVTANDGKVFLLKNTINLDGHTSIQLYALGETK